MAIFAYQNGQFEAAQALYLEAIRRSERRYAEIYFNLGSLYFRNERPDLARICYEKALQADPDNSLARDRLALMAD